MTNNSVNFCVTSKKMIEFKGTFNVCESNIESSFELDHFF